MKLLRMLAVASALSVPVLAFAFDSYRFGDRLVTVGDSATKLVDLAGQPGYKETIENERGGFEGERWQYRIDGKSVTFTIRHGEIMQISENRD